MSLSHGFVIRTAEDVSKLTTPHPDIVGDVLLNVPLTKRGLLLSGQELSELRYWASVNVRFGIFEMNEATAKAVLGLEVCDPTKVAPFIKLGDVYYAAVHNSHNRLLSDARLGNETKPGYVNDMLNELWGFGDPLQIAADGKIASAQHRAGAYLKALAVKPDLGPIEFPCIWGLPPQMIDFIDRGRERKAADMEYRDETVFQQSLIEEVFAEPETPVVVRKLRQNWSEYIVTVRNNVHCRCRGIDVHPSGTQAPSKRDALLVDHRFPREDDLQRLVLKVAAIEKNESGKLASWRDAWTVPHIATALVLRCNNGTDADPDALVLDWEYVDKLLADLADSSGDNGTGPFGPAIEDVISAIKTIKKAGGSKPGDKELFGCLVTAIGQYDESGTTDKVWLGKRDRSKKERTKDKTFRVFGGVDIGFQPKE